MSKTLNLNCGAFDPTPRPCACGTCGRIVTPHSRNDIYASDGCKQRMKYQIDNERRKRKRARLKELEARRKELGLV